MILLNRTANLASTGECTAPIFRTARVSSSSAGDTGRARYSGEICYENGVTGYPSPTATDTNTVFPIASHWRYCVELEWLASSFTCLGPDTVSGVRGAVQLDTIYDGMNTEGFVRVRGVRLEFGVFRKGKRYYGGNGAIRRHIH